MITEESDSKEQAVGIEEKKKKYKDHSKHGLNYMGSQNKEETEEQLFQLLSL